jgi:hypothetical protein
MCDECDSLEISAMLKGFYDPCTRSSCVAQRRENELTLRSGHSSVTVHTDGSVSIVADKIEVRK